MRAERATTRYPGRRLALGCAATAAAAVGLLAGTPAAALAAGAPDTAFAGGSATLPAGTELLATAAQSNGDIVAVGASGAPNAVRLLVVRYTASGALDTSFGSGGVASGPAVAGSTGTIGRAVTVQPDGKIVVVGTATDASGSARNGMLVERFNSNGSLDGSFGSGGVADLLTANGGQGNAVAIQGNGDIVAGGSATESAVPYAAVVRLSSAGAPDTSFAGHGSDILDLGAYSTVQALALQSNGAIVIAGSQSPGLQAVNALIARLTPAGALDSSFAGTGATAKQFSPAGGAYSAFTGVVVQNNGDIVGVGNTAGGNQTADAFAVRYTPAGAQDGSFGTGGVSYTLAAQNWTEQGNSVPGALAATLAPNGDVIAAGEYADSVLTYGVLWAFSPTGKLDSSFGSNGAAVLSVKSGANAEFAGVTLSPTTGNLFAAGATSSFGVSSPSGLVAGFTGYGPPTVTSPTTALKLTVTQLKATYKAGTLKLTAACNQACKLRITLGGGSGLARQLKLTTLVKKCQKHNGHETCKKVAEYRALTVASASATLGKAGSKTFTLRLSKNAVKGLHKQRSATMTLTVTATSTSTKKSVKFSKKVKFVR